MDHLRSEPPRHFIGLDVGGTKIAGGVVAFPEGDVRFRQILPTGAERGGATVLDESVRMADRLIATAAEEGLEIEGIGVGVAELVDPDGNVTSAQTIDWRGLPVATSFPGRRPAAVEADVRAAARAEARLGAGRPYRQLVYVTVGTGISSCLVLDGRPHAGARGNALVCGSSPLTTVCDGCGKPVRPILEEIASGPALVARYRGSATAGRAEEVLAAAASGDPAAREVVGSAGDALGVTVAFLINVLDPEAIIVGGGLGLAGGLYWDRFVRATREHVWAEAARELPLRMAALGNDAGLIGAALSAWEGGDDKVTR